MRTLQKYLVAAVVSMLVPAYSAVASDAPSDGAKGMPGATGTIEFRPPPCHSVVSRLSAPVTEARSQCRDS